MTPTLHFETSFWSQRSHTPLPDFQTGLQVLHQKLGQSKIENDEVINFFKDRIAIEETYATKLSDQAKVPPKPSGFGRDEGAGLKICYANLKTASGKFGAQHKQAATAMTDTVLKPLQQLNEEYKRNIITSKQAIDTTMKQFDTLVKEAERARVTYHRRCREADTAEEQALKLSEEQQSSLEQETSGTRPIVEGGLQDGAMLRLGSQTLSQSELDTLVRRMRNEITVKDHRVPILGRYQNTSTGEDIAAWLQQNLAQCKDSPAMADVVGQQLIHPYGVLRLIGQRGSKFVASAVSYYQWRINGVDDEVISASGSNTTALGGLFEKIAITTSTSEKVAGEEPHKKARRDAERADEAYRTAIKRVDQMRTVAEEALFSHFAEMEQLELHRLSILKQAFASFSSCLSATFPSDKAIVDQIFVHQESLKPEQDIQYIVQQYCVAGFAPKAILYENYYHGTAHDQSFGVSLEEIGKQTGDKVPAFVTCTLEAIKNGQETLNKDEKRKLWSTPLPLGRVHATRQDINVPSNRITVDMLKQYEPGLLVATLRLYLLELPESVMTDEFYDAAQALYSNKEQDESLRLLPLSNLIATLPGAHFATLHILLGHIHRFVQSYTENQDALSDDEIYAIGQSLGPAILRARVESLTTLTSKIPARLAQDLITHFADIFSESTLQSHAESEKRRQARPLVATKSDYPLAAGSPSPTKKRGFMSLVRPSVEETTKWGVNSMMGVFQRTASSPVSDTRTFTTATPMHFGGSAITHGSPPSSPKSNHAEIAPTTEAEVMFDVAEHINRNSKDDDDVRLKATDELENTQHDGELDPFFDDD
ncbi:hypothetical protein DFQ28_007612 [Apophysomyces sp. BC1034]|nr:hypothetical protein DFQ30_007451 [Apophysomyces sp. BC1015]KAG0176179.1 hypothetical protein DFQ29_006440 [Apophysomyces sp. BC1021]KAG0186563.1 hypothetical protein DFQ28_007612 [Apophysomyces sp. BC1034]